MAETQGTVLERFLHSALILAETSTANHEDFAATRRASQTTEADKVKSPTSPNRNRVHASPATAAAFDEAPVPISDATKTYDYATAQLVELTPATSAAIMDLRVSHSARKGVARQRNGATFERSIDVRGRIRLLSSCGDIDWTSIVDGDYLSDAVSAVLCQHDDVRTGNALVLLLFIMSSYLLLAAKNGRRYTSAYKPACVYPALGCSGHIDLTRV